MVGYGVALEEVEAPNRCWASQWQWSNNHLNHWHPQHDTWHQWYNKSSMQLTCYFNNSSITFAKTQETSQKTSEKTSSPKTWWKNQIIWPCMQPCMLPLIPTLTRTWPRPRVRSLRISLLKPTHKCHQLSNTSPIALQTTKMDQSNINKIRLCTKHKTWNGHSLEVRTKIQITQQTSYRYTCATQALNLIVHTSLLILAKTH
jgi:hypothetical protein